MITLIALLLNPHFYWIQQFTINCWFIQPEQEHSSTIIYNAVSDFSVNDNIFQTPHINNNYSHQPSNENIALTSTNSSYVPQYDQRSHSQPTENASSPFGSFSTTTINPSQTEIFSFDIPGFKIIIIPTYSQQDNTYSNYSSSDITDNQFTQFTQFQQ
jgi:hypothetical protein